MHRHSYVFASDGLDLSDGFSLNRNLCTELEEEEDINPAVADVFPILSKTLIKVR